MLLLFLMSGISLANELTDLEGFIMDHVDGTEAYSSLLQSRSYVVQAKRASLTNSILQAPVQGTGTKGVIHFLFMVNTHLPHSSVWQRFFEHAPAQSFRIWIHCSHICNVTNIHSAMPHAHVVPQAASRYCMDLVTPLVRLLKHALNSQGDPVGVREKFALISDTTLPVKPYRVIYDTLMADDLSDFGILPTYRFPHLNINGSVTALVKSSQWLILNRMHAAKLVSAWKPPPDNASERAVYVDLNRSGVVYRWQMNPQLGHGSCTDEEMVYETLCGTLQHGSNFSNTSGQFLVKTCEGTSDVVYPSNSCQGRTRTLVMWKWSMRRDDLVASLMLDEESNISMAIRTHPGTFYKTSRAALASLRVSHFLFARKFHAGSIRAEDIDILVASSVVPPDAAVSRGVVTQDALPFKMGNPNTSLVNHGSSSFNQELTEGFRHILEYKLMGLRPQMPKVILHEGG